MSENKATRWEQWIVVVGAVVLAVLIGLALAGACAGPALAAGEGSPSTSSGCCTGVDWGAVWGWIERAQLPLIVGLVVLDVGLGVAKALHVGTFNWALVGKFYKTMVLPYVLGYLALYVVVGMVPALEGIVGDGIVTAAFAAIVWNLGQSIRDNVKVLALGE